MTDNNIKTVDDFLTKQRSNPYYNVFVVLFAVLVGIEANWIKEVIVGALDASVSTAPTIDFVRLPFDLRAPRQAEYSVQLFIAAWTFMLTVYLWLFFTRVLVYVEENSIGELLSFLLALSAIIAVHSISIMPGVWGLVFLTPAVPAFLKIMHAWHIQGKGSKHPLRLKGVAWALWCLLFPLALSLFWLALTPQIWAGSDGTAIKVVSKVYAWGAVGLIGIYVVVIAKHFPKIESDVRRQIAESRPDLSVSSQ